MKQLPILKGWPQTKMVTGKCRLTVFIQKPKTKGDSFLYSQSEGKIFIYSTDVTFKSWIGAAALIFRGNNDISDKYVQGV